MPLSAGDEIRAAIAAAGGAITFESFMHIALYGGGGFYSTDGGAGRRGDFITSPEVGPLFGRVVANALDAWWHDLGEPSSFAFVDAGAGPGTLARAIRHANPRCIDALHYIAVEASAVHRERHPSWVTSSATMPAEIECGVVFANELLDNMPFRLFVMDSGWREAWVAFDANEESFIEVLRPASDVAALPLPPAAPHGARAPVQRFAGEWLTAARDSIGRGRVVIIDYMSPTTAVLAQRPWREWLRTYRGHERGGHYLREPGAQDITTEVALDQLVAAVGEPGFVRAQTQFLKRWGIDSLVDEGRRAWAEQSAAPNLAALEMRSRVREAEALLDSGGLGSFLVVEFETPAEVKES